MALNPVMETLACPYTYKYCGASANEFILHPTRRNNIKIEIQNYLFVDPETCYYSFTAPNSYLSDENMAYFWDIEITERTNTRVSLNNGTSLFDANDPIVVSTDTGSRFQYTAENNVIFISFTAQGTSVQPKFGLTVKLRAFDTRPPETPDPIYVTKEIIVEKEIEVYVPVVV